MVVIPQIYSPISALLAVLYSATTATYPCHTHTKLTFHCLLPYAAERSCWLSYHWAETAAGPSQDHAKGQQLPWPNTLHNHQEEEEEMVDGRVSGRGRMQGGQKAEMGGNGGRRGNWGKCSRAGEVWALCLMTAWSSLSLAVWSHDVSPNHCFI